MKIEARSLEAIAANPKAATPAEVGREFEAMLLSAVWKQALAPLGVSKLLSGGSAGRMYRELLVDEVARRAAARGGFGLAEALTSRLGPSDAQATEEPGDA